MNKVVTESEALEKMLSNKCDQFSGTRLGSKLCLEHSKQFLLRTTLCLALAVPVSGCMMKREQYLNKAYFTSMEQGEIPFRISPPLVDYKISSHYGKRTHPVTKKRNIDHTGTDFISRKGKKGAEVLSAAYYGKVLFAGYSKGGYGNQIVIQHQHKVGTSYSHLGKIFVQEGDVIKGDKVLFCT